MNIEHIVAKIINHPWIVAILILTFIGFNFIAWCRARRETVKPSPPPHHH